MPLNELTDQELLKALRADLKECCVISDAPICYAIPARVGRMLKEIEKRLIGHK